MLNGAVVDRFLLSNKVVWLRLISCTPLAMLLEKIEKYLSPECFTNEVRGLVGGNVFLKFRVIVAFRVVVLL